MDFHTYANLFPLLEGEGFDALVEDIRTNGVREPGWVYQGELLDGRNRYLATQKLGLPFETAEYKGDDPLGFVVSMNLIRRHLSVSQRAMLGAKLMSVYAEEAKER